MVYFAVLYSLENQPASGVVEFYYELKKNKEVRLELLDIDMNFLQEIDKRTGTIGGNIVRFDTNQIDNGNYFYQLTTDNQKTAKKIRIENPS